MGIRLDVKTEPEFTPEQLAFQLAEAIQGSFDQQRDADEYAKAIKIEERKIAEIDIMIQKVKDFRANPPKKISRMDPLATYDLDALKAQKQDAIERSADWIKRRVDAIEKVTKLQQRSTRIQKEIARLNASK